MARKVTGFIKLHVPGGQANPAPPVGPALGQHGVNILEFCKQFNAKTQDKMGLTIPVEITVYADRSFTFITKTPPASVLILFWFLMQVVGGVGDLSQTAGSNIAWWAHIGGFIAGVVLIFLAGGRGRAAQRPRFAGD